MRKHTSFVGDFVRISLVYVWPGSTNGPRTPQGSHFWKKVKFEERCGYPSFFWDNALSCVMYSIALFSREWLMQQARKLRGNNRKSHQRQIVPHAPGFFRSGPCQFHTGKTVSGSFYRITIKDHHPGPFLNFSPSSKNLHIS